MKPMEWAIAYVLIGVFVLYVGAEWLVKGAARLALSWGISSLVVGLTIVSMATSMPEAVASFMAQLSGGRGDIALGNVIGSNISNVALIVGVTALIRPLDVVPVVRYRETSFMIGCTVLLLLLMWGDPIIGSGAATILLAVFVFYILWQLYLARGFHEKEEVFEEFIDQGEAAPQGRGGRIPPRSYPHWSRNDSPHFWWLSPY